MVSIDSMSDSERVRMEIDFLQGMLAQSTNRDPDFVQNNSVFIQKENKKIDGLKAIKTTNQFWAYHVKAKMYAHGFGENEMFFFVSKNYKADIDSKNSFPLLNK